MNKPLSPDEETVVATDRGLVEVESTLTITTVSPPGTFGSTPAGAELFDLRLHLPCGNDGLLQEEGRPNSDMGLSDTTGADTGDDLRLLLPPPEEEVLRGDREPGLSRVR